MRHRKIDLTMNVYTDPTLLDVRGALDALTPLPLEGNPVEGNAVLASGTDAQTTRKFAPTPNQTGQPGAFSVITT
jgi:hypothetical protein